ncbi:hypothetical protein [Actinomarinicola tropica]|uniref:Uncharacterized protein n=1 Tax=Actinomarinicola tropica TaxID=2789776 RepID=A0A5Q2RIE6_9ACTN|nr:hypothetical protein [Actinomarinicola tropica]QGG93767.1 hypothetical protein GH723_00805 [Actinomarinicola tropica]
MTDLEHRLRRMGTRAPRPALSDLRDRVGERRRRRRAVVVSSLGLVGAVVLGGALVLDRGPDARPVATDTSVGPRDENAGATSVVRPLLDVAGCVPSTASEMSYQRGLSFTFESIDGAVVHAAAFGEPTSGIAVVLHLSDDQVELGRPPSSFTDSIGGRSWHVVGNARNGSGEAWLDRAEGGWLYVRAHGVTDQKLRELLASIDVPRAGAATPTALRQEGGEGWRPTGVDTAPMSIDVRRSTCIVDGHEVGVSVRRGSTAALYLDVLDRPEPSLHRVQDDGSVLLLDGPSAIVDERWLSDVVDAEPDTWSELMRD